MIEALIIRIRGWIKDYKFLSETNNFSYLSTILLSELCGMIMNLIDIVTSKNGKKQVSTKQKETDKKLLQKKFDAFLDKIVSEIESLKTYDTDISEQMENFVQQSFKEHMGKEIMEKEKYSQSSRGEKTIVFPCSDGVS